MQSTSACPPFLDGQLHPIHFVFLFRSFQQGPKTTWEIQNMHEKRPFFLGCPLIWKSTMCYTSAPDKAMTTKGMTSQSYIFDIFETPVTMTPQQEISKTPNSLQLLLGILNIYFWGDNIYFGGKDVYFWVFSKILGFWEFLLCCWGCLGLCRSGGPVGVFADI